MRICYIAQGESWHTQKWLEYFIEKGHDVHLVTYRWGKHVESIKNKVTVHFLNPPLNIPKISFFEKVYMLKKIIKQIYPDILHAQPVVPYGTLGALTGFHPLIITAWGSEVLLTPDKNIIVKFTLKYVLRHADVIISGSKYLENVMIKYGASQNRCHIIQWGADLRYFHPQVDSSEIRKQLHLERGPVILSSRSFKSVYNIDIIIKSIPYVLKEIPSAKFVFKYGEGEQKKEMRDLANKIGVSQSVRFIGYVDYEDMPKYYAASDICVSVPSSDGMPRAIWEAMACGIPLIVSDLPWKEELLKSGENAFIVPVRDVKSLASAIIKILKNERLRAEFREYNIMLVKKEADYLKNMAKMEAFYKDLIRK